MESVSLALSPGYVSPLTSRSLGRVEASVSQTQEPTPPSDALQSRLSGNRLRAEAASEGVARTESERQSAFLPTAIRDLTSIQSFLTAADDLAEGLEDQANVGFIQRAFTDYEFGQLLEEAQDLAVSSEYGDQTLLDADEDVSFVISSGTEENDRVTVQLLSAQLDDLSSGLSSSDLLSDANVTSARDQLEDALETVEGQLNLLEIAEDRIATGQEAQLSNISGLNAAFQAQLQFQQALNESRIEETNSTVSNQIQAYLQIVALDFNEVTPAEASFKVHFDLQA